MRIAQTKCDYCGKVVANHTESVFVQPPADWFVVFGKFQADLCSAKCLADWATDRQIELPFMYPKPEVAE